MVSIMTRSSAILVSYDMFFEDMQCNLSKIMPALRAKLTIWRNICSGKFMASIPLPDLGGASVQSRWNPVHLAMLGDAVWEVRYCCNIDIKPAFTRGYINVNVLMCARHLIRRELELTFCALEFWSLKVDTYRQTYRHVTRMDKIQRTGGFAWSIFHSCIVRFAHALFDVTVKTLYFQLQGRDNI